LQGPGQSSGSNLGAFFGTRTHSSCSGIQRGGVSNRRERQCARCLGARLQQRAVACRYCSVQDSNSSVLGRREVANAGLNKQSPVRVAHPTSEEYSLCWSLGVRGERVNWRERKKMKGNMCFQDKTDENLFLLLQPDDAAERDWRGARRGRTRLVAICGKNPNLFSE
jgi:hypothetical protein